MEKTIYKIIPRIVSSLLFFLMVVSVVNAAGIVPCKDNCTICDLFTLVKNILNFITLVLAVPVGIGLFIYGGFQLITSGGSEQKIESGKKAITRAFFGLIIVFGAYAIVNTLLGWLVKKEFLDSIWPGLSQCR